MGRGGRGEPGQGVAPLERRHDPSPGMPVGDLPDDGGELGEVGIGEGEPAEGIADARVEAGRDEDELRSEAVGRRHEPIAERADDLPPPGACWEGAVDREALPRVSAGLVGMP